MTVRRRRAVQRQRLIHRLAASEVHMIVGGKRCRHWTWRRSPALQSRRRKQSGPSLLPIKPLGWQRRGHLSQVQAQAASMRGYGQALYKNHPLHPNQEGCRNIMAQVMWEKTLDLRIPLLYRQQHHWSTFSRRRRATQPMRRGGHHHLRSDQARISLSSRRNRSVRLQAALHLSSKWSWSTEGTPR